VHLVARARRVAAAAGEAGQRNQGHFSPLASHAPAGQPLETAAALDLHSDVVPWTRRRGGNRRAVKMGPVVSRWCRNLRNDDHDFSKPQPTCTSKDAKLYNCLNIGQRVQGAAPLELAKHS